jgi:hypothetical protein
MKNGRNVFRLVALRKAHVVQTIELKKKEYMRTQEERDWARSLAREQQSRCVIFPLSTGNMLKRIAKYRLLH